MLLLLTAAVRIRLDSYHRDLPLIGFSFRTPEFGLYISTVRLCGYCTYVCDGVLYQIEPLQSTSSGRFVNDACHPGSIVRNFEVIGI